MRDRYFNTSLILALALVASLTGCKEKKQIAREPAGESAKAAVRSSRPVVNACDLITKDEVAAIQQAPISDGSGKQNPWTDFVISECFFSSSAPNMSVSLGLIQLDPERPANKTVTQYWKDRFAELNGGDSDKEGGREREEEERHRPPPQKIEGLGEDAYWSLTGVGGTLFVLKNDIICRISVGGPDKPEIRLEKSKQIAAKILGKL